ncbi:RND superfamily putative drug exporter [Actinomadura pelletieri DSM 43383]|uniref:RND superfamily putative drug exporter n=1 Tax=Actinomadura pelletieri DSM 43383 TaxID=1120940 RepID=A0A495QU20_9ACTN|nr:MMPL family transporter [Actinomadura pelletieri]RKS77032.1 RND superfamily putative drug exporter [Actinomadura pelletieri DSM 43383]
MLERLGRWCHRRRKTVVVSWILLAFTLVSVGGMVKPDFDSEFALRDADSQRAYEVLAEHFPDRSTGMGEIVFHAPSGLADPTVRSRVERIVRDFGAADPTVTGVVSPFDEAGGGTTSVDGRTGRAQIWFSTARTEVPDEVRDELRARAAEQNGNGLQVELSGTMFAPVPDTSLSETVGLTAAVVILLVAFGSLLIVGMPLLTALVGLFGSLGLVMLLTKVMEVPDFTMSVAIMIVLGVGVDYALFLVTRYRTALRAGRVPEEAAGEATATAGRAVLFAGVTVIISLMGMLFMGVGFVHGLALGCALGVLITMIVAVTLVPALLGLFGERRLRRWADRRDGSGAGWVRWNGFVQRRAAVLVVLGVVVTGAVALPALAMRLGSNDAGNLPTSDTTRRAHDLKQAAFGLGSTAPLTVAAELDGTDPRALDPVVRRLAATPGVDAVSRPVTSADGRAVMFTVKPDTAAQDPETAALVREVREEILPWAAASTGARLHVGGVTATFEDLADRMASRLAVFVAAVLGLSFVLLILVFRSVVVPVLAVALTVLSLGAAYGVLVAVFQWGWAMSLFGLGRTGPLESYTPMTLMALLFGLSMDYQMFLLSRIKEAAGTARDARDAVTEGLRASGRVILAAALIMAAVFGGFTLSPDRIMKQFGLGLAVAILVQAVLVLTVAPAVLGALGSRAWWLPRALRRLPDLHVEGTRKPVPEEAPVDSLA